MKPIKLAKVGSIVSILLSSLGCINALAITLMIRALSESKGLPVFVLLLSSMIVCALTRMFLGVLGLTSEYKPMYLIAFLFGASALVFHVLTIIIA